MDPKDINQPIATPTNQPVSNTNQPIATPTNQPTNQSPLTTSQSSVSPKKAWPLALAWLVFAISTLLFLALGPGTIIVAAITSPYSWLASYWWMPAVYGKITYLAPILLVLAIISIIFTYKKFPAKMRTVFILLSSIIIGLPVTWLGLNGIIPMNNLVYMIFSGIITVAPITLLVVSKIRDKKKVTSLTPPKPINKKAAKITYIFSLVVLAIELVFAIIQLATPILNLITIHEQEKQTEQAIESAASSSGSKSSKELSKMVYAVCLSGEYEVVYQSTEDTGIFQCKENSEVYSVTVPQEEESGYWDAASGSFLGTTYNEAAEKNFPDTIYIYRNYANSEIYTDLILLVEAGSEQEAIDKYIDNIYGFIKDVSSEYSEEVRISLFYTDNLDTVKEVRDYIVLSGAIGMYDWFPHGNGLGGYAFEADEAAALAELGKNPDLYSSQTRDAIKFHRHISAEIDDGETITLEQLRELLQISFEEGL